MFIRSAVLKFFAVVSLISIAAGRSLGDPSTVTVNPIPAYRALLASTHDPTLLKEKKLVDDGPMDLAKAKEAALKAGVSLVASPTAPPDDQNSAPIYDQWSKMRNVNTVRLPDYANPLRLKFWYTYDQIATVRKFFTAQSASEHVLSVALSRPYYYVPGSSGEAFPSLATLRAAARDFTSQATLLALDGKWDDAASTEAQGFIPAKQVAQQHTLIAELVAYSIDGITVDGLTNILANARPDVKLSGIVFAAIPTDVGSSLIKQSLTGELASSISDLDQFKAQTVPADVSFSSDDLQFIRDLMDATEALKINNTLAVLAVADESRTQRRADVALIDQQDPAPSSPSSSDIVGTMLNSVQLAYSEVIEHDDVNNAREQVLLAGASVLALDATTGSFPATLPGNLIDPFSGVPLKYKLITNGFVVYSVGPSGTFDGSSNQGTGWDSAFIYPALPKQPAPTE